MSKTLEQLTSDRNAAYSKLEELRKKLPETGGFSAPEDRAAWDACNKDYDEATATIDSLKSGAEVRARMKELQEQRDREARDNPRGDINRADHGRNSGDLESAAKDLFNAWGRAQVGGRLSKREKQLCEQYKLNPRKSLPLSLSGTEDLGRMQRARNSVHDNQRCNVPVEKRALTVSATSGGDMIARAFIPEFEAAMLDFSGVLQACEIITTDTGATLDWPTANDTGNAGAMLAINTAAATNTDPVTAAMSLGSFKGTSNIVLVPFELVTDDGAGFIVRLPAMLGERVGRLVNAQGTTGVGTTAPTGIVTASAAGVTAAATNAITADELISLEHTVDPSYRLQGSGYMMHDSIIKAIRLLKDSENRYLWSSGLRDNRPDTLNGYRVFLNQGMASSLAASAKVVLFGKLSAFKVRMVRGLRFVKLVERYGDADQVGFVCFLRFDSNILNAGVAPIKRITMAAS